MADRYEVTCINRRDRVNPYERITHIGGTYANGLYWKLTVEEAIMAIKSGVSTYFVIQDWKVVDVIIASRNGREYLKTAADGEEENNLLRLPECP
jgi:hypothetical protein